MHGRVDLVGWLRTDIHYTRPKMVTHPSTNRARRRVTLLIRPTTPNEVTLRRARLVLGWVTIFERV